MMMLIIPKREGGGGGGGSVLHYFNDHVIECEVEERSNSNEDSSEV